ncbi:MAG: hypothetical protein PUP90_17510 [Nostoc sp. S4]|nr:hypothetical protein [Nostoc sp. S4]
MQQIFNKSTAYTVDRVTGEEQPQLPERSLLIFILQSGDSIKIEIILI